MILAAADFYSELKKKIMISNYIKNYMNKCLVF